jgi:hypothetical protein
MPTNKNWQQQWDKMITVRVSNEQHAMIKDRAKRCNKSMNTLLIDLALDGFEPQGKPTTPAKKLGVRRWVIGDIVCVELTVMESSPTIRKYDLAEVVGRGIASIHIKYKNGDTSVWDAKSPAIILIKGMD